jgi:hypothetical protein
VEDFVKRSPLRLQKLMRTKMVNALDRKNWMAVGIDLSRYSSSQNYVNANCQCQYLTS